MIFCAISIQSTQGLIGPGQWKLGLRDYLKRLRLDKVLWFDCIISVKNVLVSSVALYLQSVYK